MLPTDELLTQTEICERSAFWALDWQRAKITFQELLGLGVREGVTTSRVDHGEAAGEFVIGIASQREILTKELNVYDLCVHNASIADIVSCAIRRPQEPPWTVPAPHTLPNGMEWQGSAFLAPGGASLRRIVLVSHWDEDRHYSFARSWETIGNVALYQLPMQLAICILGQARGGKRYGYFSRGYRHPINRGLRFRKRTDATSKFKSSWEQIFREDFDEIPTADWLSAMHQDGVLADSCFSVTVDVPNAEARKHVLELASRKLDKIMSLKTVPDEQFTSCSWPVRCQYISPCHSGQSPNGKFGFVPVDQLG
jgi:hypothetical protein